MSKIFFDAPAWWRQPGWQLAAAALAMPVALAIWWTALSPVDQEPIAQRTPAAPTVAARSVPPHAEIVAPAAAPPPAAASSPAAPTPTPSTMVAPGVHITPVGVPPGTTVPMPAGPKADDSEPEN